MLIYLIIIFIIILLNKKINNKFFSKYDCFIIILLSLVCGLRYNVGSDYLLYQNAFNNLATYERMEFGVATLIKILNGLGFSYNTFLTIISFCTITFSYFSIKKYSKYPYQSLFLFICLGYYSMCFNGIRQMLAVSICLFSLKYLFNRKLFKYIICIGFAGTCHFTSLIMLPLYFIVDRIYSKKTLILFMMVSFILYFLYNPLLYAFTHMFPVYMPYYQKTSLTYWKPGVGTYLIGTMHILMALIIIKYKNKIIKEDEKNKFYINLFFLSIPFYVLSFQNALVSRFTYYFAIYEIFLIPYIINIFFIKKNKYITIIITILFIVYYIIHLYSFNQMIPYNWIFNA